MQYGICPLSVVPLRNSPDDNSSMLSQILYGEHFKVLEQRKHWSKIRCALDHFEGWVLNNQIILIEQSDYQNLEDNTAQKNTSDLISFVETNNRELIPIVMGSSIPNKNILNHIFEGSCTDVVKEKNKLIQTALLYLNTPYLNGGRTPFGIDCAGFTQMVYKINGHKLLRTALEQSTQGDALSFIEESEAGDLAFFDDNEGIINHVGLIMENNYIIHANGKIRIDRIDHTGIFNSETKTYSHKLRVIKQIA